MNTAARVERRLAAIMSADVAGYSRLMGRDEPGTLSRLKLHRKELIEPLLSEHHGRIVKLMGDGALCEFGSAVDAVSCSLAIQSGMAEREASIPEDARIRFRIGINVGDVIVDGEDIFGDGVNVTSRLEKLAEPGGICISGSAYQQVKGKLACSFAPLGPQDLKNIAEPIEAWRVVPDRSYSVPTKGSTHARIGVYVAGAVGLVLLAGLAVISNGGHRPAGDAVARVATSDILALPKGPTVGVVPFTTTDTEPGAVSFADGMTDEITSKLTRFPDLHVIARNTMSRYKNKPVDARDLGRDLGLIYVLDGTVRLLPDAVRVSAELVDAKDARQIWSDSYDRPLTAEAVISVQDDVAARIASAVGAAHGGAIVQEQWKASLGKPPKELSSYECVVAAHAFFNSDKGYELARACLRETTRREPDYAEAWALLASIYIEQWYGYAEPYPNETYDPLERAADAARRAVSLSPDSPRAHHSLAKVHLMSGDLENFYAEAQQALRLNPNDPDYLCRLGSWIAFPGRWDEGLALIHKARKLHPGIRCGEFALAINHYRKGEYAQALTDFNTSFTGWWVNYMHRAYTYGMLGDQENAARAVAKLNELVPGFTMEHAIAFHRKYQFERAVLDKIVEGLRLAGVPENAQTPN
jgi:class 3 adenylate cyclase/TolB-like protein/cytochrome c-type biogenesis protein CcmH/NrfG